MDKKYVNYLNDMLTHIRKGEELSKKSKEVGKKYGVAHDLIYYAQLTGHIKRVTKGKYVSTVSRFTIIDAEEIYESRCKKLQKLKKAKAKADKKQLSLFTPKNVIVEGGIYKHPQHGLVVVDEIMSDSIAYVLLLETTSLQIRRDVHSSKLVRAENEETKFENEIKDKITGLGVRAMRCLNVANIKTANELAQHSISEISNIPGIGQTTINEFEEYLSSKGLSFKEEAKKEKKISELHRKIIECVNKNEKVDDIASKFGVHKSTISTVAKNNGISIGSIRKKEREDKVIELRSDLDSGMSKKDVELKYKNYPKLHSIIRVHFTKVDSRSRISERNDKIVSLYKEGYTLKNISELLELGIPTISAIIRERKAYKFPSLCLSVADKKKRSKELYEYISSLRKKYKLTFQQIADELNENGYRTLRGSEYTVGNVMNMFNRVVEEIEEVKTVKVATKKADDYLSLYAKKFKKHIQ